MSKTVAVLIRNRERQFEGLRFSLGLLLEQHSVSMIVLQHEIQLSEEYLDNMEFIDEMGGARFSDVPGNVSDHGFRPIQPDEIAQQIEDHDLVVPF